MRKLFLAALLFALLGLAASILMTRLHYRIGEKGFEEKSFCNVSEFIDCDTALASRYSQIRTRFGTLPTSELGVLYYLFFFGALLFARTSSQKGGQGALGTFLFLSSVGALAYSLVMAYLSIFKLGVLCLLCLTTYLANLLLLFLVPRLFGVRVREVAGLVPRVGLPLGAFLLTVAIGLVFFRGLNPGIHKVHAEVPREAYLKLFYSQPRQEMNLPERPAWGAPEAKVTLVEFSDFQCPFCRRAAFSLKPYLKEFREKIRFVFMNYPLDNACNPAIAHAMHSVACLSAKAALCAFREGTFWEYHDRIFENQKRLSRATLLRLANETGMDSSRFEQCLVSDETAALLKEDVEAGSRLEVRGTPAIFIGGRPLRDWSRPEILRIVIEAELKGSGASPPEPVPPAGD